jgi:dephospho-CoA kinase
VAVIDAIKLIEAGWKAICDTIWVVTCTQDIQLARLVATRAMSQDEALQRIAAQPPQADKVAQASVVIDNSGSLEETRRQVEAAWRAILRTGQ